MPLEKPSSAPLSNADILKKYSGLQRDLEALNNLNGEALLEAVNDAQEAGRMLDRNWDGEPMRPVTAWIEKNTENLKKAMEVAFSELKEEDPLMKVMAARKLLSRSPSPTIREHAIKQFDNPRFGIEETIRTAILGVKTKLTLEMKSEKIPGIIRQVITNLPPESSIRAKLEQEYQ